MKEGLNESLDHIVVNDGYFDQDKAAKIPGFSFCGKISNTKGYAMPPSNTDGRPSELVYLNNWSRETAMVNKSLDNPFGSNPTSSTSLEPQKN